MKFKILKVDILILLLILPYIFPDSLMSVSIIGDIVKVWKILTGIWVVLYTLNYKKVNPLLIILTVFYVSIMFSAIIHNNSILDKLSNISILWIINYLSEKEDIRKRLFKVLTIVLTLFAVINVASMLIFPNGMYATEVYELNWFLGYKNIIIRKVLPLIVIILINSYGRKIDNYEKIGLLCSLISILLSTSINNYIGITIFILSYIFLQKNMFFKNITLTKIFVVYSITNFILVLSNVISKFNYLIKEILHKSGSISGRLEIWDATLKHITNSPIIGYGSIESSMYNLSFKVTHPHNLLLYYLMFGGIVCIVIFAKALNVVDKSKKQKLRYINNIFLSFYISCCVMGLSESLTGLPFFIPFLIIMYNINTEVKK